MIQKALELSKSNLERKRSASLPMS